MIGRNKGAIMGRKEALGARAGAPVRAWCVECGSKLLAVPDQRGFAGKLYWAVLCAAIAAALQAPINWGASAAADSRRKAEKSGTAAPKAPANASELRNGTPGSKSTKGVLSRLLSRGQVRTQSLGLAQWAIRSAG